MYSVSLHRKNRYPREMYPKFLCPDLTDNWFHSQKPVPEEAVVSENYPASIDQVHLVHRRLLEWGLLKAGHAGRNIRPV